MGEEAEAVDRVEQENGQPGIEADEGQHGEDEALLACRQSDQF